MAEDSASSSAATPTASGPAPGADATQVPPSAVPPAGRESPTTSRTDLPTLRPPTAPPRRPTDAKPTDVLAGRITRGGDGPCYGLVTDDGREYALWGVDQGSFAVGTWVRVTTSPVVPKINCGRGTPASILKIDPVG